MSEAAGSVPWLTMGASSAQPSPHHRDSRVIKFDASGWKFADRERQLYAEAKTLPTWKLANLARRVLASFAQQLSLEVPSQGGEFAELDATSARQLATIQLAMVAVRQTGSVLTLIGTGYELEAMAHARTLLEAQYRARQASDDSSGEAARSILQGRPPKSLKQLANHYGDKREIELLDHFAHADVRQLLSLAHSPLPVDDVSGEVWIEVRPTRGRVRPAHQLYVAAHTATSISAVLAEVFGVAVAIPGWLSEELLHYRDNPLPEPL